VLVVSLAGLPGCGGSSDEDDVKATMTDFLGALAKGDGQKACSLADASGRARLVQAAKGQLTCERVIAAVSARLPAEVKSGLENAEVKKVTVNGNTATIKDSDITSSKGNVKSFLSGGTPTKLVKEDGKWKLSGTRG
jgi:hypothetical protein